MTLSRQEMIGRLEWNEGVSMLGTLTIAESMRWEMERPGPGKPDLKSIVSVCGPADRYTDEELEKIVALAERVTARYDEMFRSRWGANLFIVDRPDGREQRWMIRRLSDGPRYYGTLDEALAAMER